MIKVCPKCGNKSMELVGESGEWWYLCWECDFETNDYKDDEIDTKELIRLAYCKIGVYNESN